MINRLFTLVVLALVVTMAAFSGGTQEEPGTAEPISMTMWHPFGPSGHPGGGEFFNEKVAEFTSAHPNIQFEATLHGVLELRQKMQVALPAGTQPTMWFGGPAAATLGQFAQAGYVANLTPFYDKYDWKGRMLEKGLQYISYKGQFFGVPHNPDLVVIYYNKDMFKANGWSVPETFDQFTSLVDKIKSQDLVPIAFGNRDGWPGVNFMTVMLDFQAGARDHYKNVLFGDARWDVPAFIDGAKLFVQLHDMGAFNKDINALSAYDASLLFANGEAPMFIQGTWQMAGVIKDATFEAGMFLLPTNDSKRPRATAASYGPFFSVGANASDQEIGAACEFLNFLLVDNANAWYERTAVAPSQKIDLSGIDFFHPLAKERAEMVNKYLDLAVFDLHTAPPRSISSNHMYAGIQALLDHKMAPEAFWKRTQELWVQEKAAGAIWEP